MQLTEPSEFTLQLALVPLSLQFTLPFELTLQLKSEALQFTLDEFTLQLPLVQDVPHGKYLNVYFPCFLILFLYKPSCEFSKANPHDYSCAYTHVRHHSSLIAPQYLCFRKDRLETSRCRGEPKGN